MHHPPRYARHVLPAVSAHRHVDKQTYPTEPRAIGIWALNRMLCTLVRNMFLLAVCVFFLAMRCYSVRPAALRCKQRGHSPKSENIEKETPERTMVQAEARIQRRGMNQSLQADGEGNVKQLRRTCVQFFPKCPRSHFTEAGLPEPLHSFNAIKRVSNYLSYSTTSIMFLYVSML